jgi:hypothetical protein
MVIKNGVLYIILAVVLVGIFIYLGDYFKMFNTLANIIFFSLCSLAVIGFFYGIFKSIQSFFK